jgi:zinc transporter ZupT
MYKFLSTLIIVALFSILGGLFSSLIKKRYKRYLLLAEMFLTIIIISELMKEGFAVTGFITLSLIVGMVFIYITDKLTRIRKLYTNLNRKLLRELPKSIAIGVSFAVDISLGIAIGILLSLYNIPKGILMSYKEKQRIKALKELGTVQFVFIIISIIAYITATYLNLTAKAVLMTFAAGMMLFIVIEQGILFKND